MCTTVKADNEILNDYTYKLYALDTTGHYHIFLSDYEISQTTYSGYTSVFDPNTGILYRNGEPINGAPISTLVPASGYTALPVHMYYVGDQWEYIIPYTSTGTVTSTRWVFGGTSNFQTISSTKINGTPNIPEDLTKADVTQLIDSKLNATTSTTTQAQNIQTQVTNNYISYTNGEIDLATLQANIDSLTQQLQNLNNISSNTIADKIAINNAQLQVQIVQDAANTDKMSGYLEEIYNNQELTSACKSRVTTYQNRINTIYNNFTSGSITQTEAITQVRNYITDCHYYIAQATSQADIDAYNAVINAATGTLESISNYKELDPSVSDKAQQSDQEEMEYLEDITAETTDNIDSLKSKVDSSISESQANEVKEQVISPLLQNTLIVKVLPIAALFMVLAVTLGFKYKL